MMLCAEKVAMLPKIRAKRICRTLYLIITKIEYYAKYFVEYS